MKYYLIVAGLMLSTMTGSAMADDRGWAYDDHYRHESPHHRRGRARDRASAPGFKGRRAQKHCGAEKERNILDRADRNRDGRLSRRELRVAKAHLMRKGDRNRDGRLSRHEWRAISDELDLLQRVESRDSRWDRRRGRGHL